MAIEYPKGPAPAGEELNPGEGINAEPFGGNEYIDLTGPPGLGTKVYYGLSFQFPKWGFQRYKIDEAIFVSPLFKPYYDLTINQKAELEARVKEGLRSIALAISDLELVSHDLRKYAEFMDYYQKIEKGKREKNKDLNKEGDQTLKSVFIDQVDVHTGEGIALKLIASRWPTIIADFMRLTDEEIDTKKIAEKLKVSEAEAVVLATKNKLYLEWRDKLFRPTVEERYKTLFGLVEARRTSVKEYKEMLKPTIIRYRMITDSLSKPELAAGLYKSFFRPDAQAFSLDSMHIWAWKPFAPSEKYKITRELSGRIPGTVEREMYLPLDEIPASKAGFTDYEIEQIKKEKGDKWDKKVKALPQEPSIDKVVRDIIKKIEGKYGVKISGRDIYKARQMLVDEFDVSYKGTRSIETWIYSPYYIFLDIPIGRSVIRTPDGVEMENIILDNLKVATQTQNIIIGHCIELLARDKEMEKYIQQLLGEYGSTSEEKVGSVIEEKYPEIYLNEEEVKKREEDKKRIEKLKKSSETIGEVFKKIRTSIGSIFAALGWEVMFLRAEGPYEFMMQHRLAKYYQTEVSAWFATVREYLKANFEVPGAKA